MKQRLLLLMTAFLMGVTSWAQVPKADLLDIVFNDDGTATDVSECQNTVELFGTPNVVESSKYGINVACFHENAYNSNCAYWYKVDYGTNMDFMDGLADGHSLELLCRLELDGDYAELIGAGNEIKPFSSHQGGGTGLMVCTRTTDDAGNVTRGNEWTFLPYSNGEYHWTNSGVPAVGGEYVHLIGVWDKEKGESRIYVNGELKYVNTDAAGDFKLSSLTYFVVGGDPGGSGANQSFKGDIAIARVYDDPLTDAQASALYEEVNAMDTGSEEHVDQVVYDPYFSFLIDSQRRIECSELEEPYSFEIVTTGDDPYISMSPLQKPLGEDQTVITFEYICTMGAPGSEFFFSLNGSYQGGRETTFDIPAADDWTPFYLDLSTKMADFNWGHTIGELLRWDIGNAAGITLYVRNIHFITKAEYQEIVGGSFTLTQDADGWYLVNSPEDLKVFADAVNSGSFRFINVRLTEDLDLGGMDWTAIGIGNCYNKATGPNQITNEGFGGVFDGQGHTISNFNIAEGADADAVGLFGIVTGTVKNVGVIGATFNATKDCRAGGIAGSVVSTTTSTGLVENCFVINSTILTTERVCGAVVGAVSGATVQNCYGLNNELSGYGERFGGVAGDTKNDGSWAGTVNNCYTDFPRVTSSQYGSTVNSQAGVSAERFESGEITYRLNGTTTVESVWRQNIGEDPYPVLDKTRGYVMPSGNDYISITEGNFENVRDQIVADESEFNANTICAYDLTDSYEEILASLGEASSIAEFFQAYDEVAALKGLLISSANAYAAYQTKIDDVSAYLDENNNFTGPEREKLETYLNDNVEPCEDYPNGSYEYIIEKRLLDNDGLAEEIAFVQAMLDRAVESGYEAGADITNLLKNADFSDGTNGWTIEGGSASVANVGGAGVQYVAESGSKLNLSQTLRGLTPGFYQVKVNAAYRAAGDNNNMNQASFLYANNNKVYLPTLREGLIPAESDSPNLDRYTPVEDEDGIYIGYMPTSTSALAFAFGEGYYQSTIVTEVGEDGVLTLGVNTPGCNKTNTTWVGAFHVIYCGTADTEYSQAAFDETQECQVARLSALANDYVYDDYDFAAAPNYSEALKAEVQAQTAGASSASYDKITELGDLMQKVYDCKQAYAMMMAKAEVILDLYSNMALSGMLSDEEANTMDQAYTSISDAYLDGSYSLEEALAADPFTSLPFMPAIENGVAKISDSRQLMVFSAMVNSGYYREMDAVLENDIDMSGIDFYAPIGYATLSELNHTGQPITNPGYAGTFDGQGHLIKNLTACYSSTYAASGVFGTITGTVKNLGISGYYFDNGQAYSGRFGALCGQLVEGHILNCYVVNSTVIDTNEIVSAIAAGNYAGVVENCYEYGNNIQPYPRAGMLVGDARDDNGIRVGTEINCYSENFVTGYGRSNGYASNMTDCESNVRASRFQSGEIAYLLNKGVTEGEDLVWRQTIHVDESPVLDKTHYIVRKTDSGAYTNFDDTNADLLALVEEAQSLSAMTKVVGHEALITSGDQLSDNCLWQAGYEIQTIIDGNQATYFHSRIDTPLSEGTEYFQVDLPFPVKGFYLDYWGRSDGAGTGNIWHDTPDKIRIEGTNTPEDESSWVVLTTEEYDVPDIDGAHYVSEEPVMLGGAYQYIRFYILHSTHGMNYWNITEFQMFNAGDSDQSPYQADPEIAKAVDAVDACAAEKEQKAISGTGTKADIDELQALIDKLREVTGYIKEHKGTKEDPLQIASAEDLQNLRSKMRTGETTYVILTNDIDMSEVENWIPLNDWSDEADGKNWMNWIDFNGQGHVISNLTSTSESGYDYASVFGVICGTVRNVGFENIAVDCTNTGSGVLGGYMGHTNFTDADGNKLTSILENVWVTGSLNVSSGYCGGLIGNIGGPSIIKNCYVNLEIASEANYVGGLVGRVRDALTMQNVYAAGSMNTGGGIIGGGQNATTPASTYTNCVVWNNTSSNFGETAEGDQISGVSYYNGSNFAALQQTVVGWGSPWTCDMADGSYPVFDKEKLTSTGEEQQPLVADHSRKLLLETSQLSDNCYWVFPSLDMSVNTLLDGSMTTHFHSDATNATPLSQLNQYIQMDLREAQKAVQIYFAGRNLEPIGPVTNPSMEMINTPNHIIILATNTPDDEESWKQVAEFTDGFPGVVVGGEYYSPCFEMGGEYRYLRMVVKGAEQSQVYWNISELQVYPAGTTGIDQLAQPVRMQSNGIYSIDGRLISRDPADVKSLPKGLYIVGGRKVAVK